MSIFTIYPFDNLFAVVNKTYQVHLFGFDFSTLFCLLIQFVLTNLFALV